VIFFNSGFNRNTLINEASGVIQGSSPTANAIGSSGSAIDFTNMGTIIGSVVFSGHGSDTFNAVTGSSVTGAIDGGSGTGNNTLTMSGSGTGTMSSVLANWSTVIKTDSGTWTMTANNTYTGTTSINAGVLIVNGSIASSSLTTVNSGAALFGTGTVGSTVVNSGGFLVPGNSPGTLTISGNLALQSGAFYVVQVSPTTNSTTNVSGTASLAGTVGAVFATGSYVAATPF
jgi:autotransporter-associated beta strand protein